MTSTLAPVLVYNRIDENRLNTVLLLPAFAVLVLPLAYGVTQLLVPFSFYHTYVTMGAFRLRGVRRLPADIGSIDGRSLLCGGASRTCAWARRRDGRLHSAQCRS